MGGINLSRIRCNRSIPDDENAKMIFMACTLY